MMDNIQEVLEKKMSVPYAIYLFCIYLVPEQSLEINDNQTEGRLSHVWFMAFSPMRGRNSIT